jgi:hypothetical protein
MIEVVFETHATTTDNEAGIATGWGQGRLSRGRRDGSTGCRRAGPVTHRAAGGGAWTMLA